jgi:DNA-directed RNA polymerase specialized sigma24 family protein
LPELLDGLHEPDSARFLTFDVGELIVGTLGAARAEVDEYALARQPHEALELARAALDALAPRYQATLTLFYLEDLTIAEVAAVLGCRPGTVKAQLSRGRELLRRKLAAFQRELHR